MGVTSERRYSPYSSYSSYSPCTRREFVGGLLLFGAAGRSVAGEPGLADRVDASLLKARGYLMAKQSADGAWRSEIYGNMQDGTALTPTVLNTIYFLPPNTLKSRGDRTPAAGSGGDEFARGVAFLARMVGPDGTLKPPPYGLDYPVLTAGPACRVLSLSPQTPGNAKALAAWLLYLKERRLSRSLGWNARDPEFGGWGFAPRIPRKPPDGAKVPLVESNLVATLFGILGLMSGKVLKNDPVWGEILQFVFRCQNFDEKAENQDPRFDDGGFFFIPGDAAQNKAGVSGRDRFGHERYRSYGSMTADGLRALIRSGLAKDHPRVAAARKWLESNFSAILHPGEFSADRLVLKDATYYYYAWAVAHAFLALDQREVQTASGKVRWAEALAEELIKRQRADGSWKNRYSASREDDPLIATPLAASALGICRLML